MRRVLAMVALLIVSSRISLATAGPLADALGEAVQHRLEYERSSAAKCIKLAQAVNARELQYIEATIKEMRSTGAKESQEPLITLIREAMFRKIRGESLKEQLRLIESKESMLPACDAQVAKTLRDIAYDLNSISFQLQQRSLEGVLKELAIAA